MGTVIITAALTGAIHTPSMSEYLPFTPGHIIEDAVRCHDAGAAVVHVHARNPKDGSPSSSGDIFREILSGIKARSKVVVTPTTGGSPAMTPQERLAVVSALKPEMATFNAGSLNFAKGTRSMGTVIITAALTGAIHTPSMSEYLPFTQDTSLRRPCDVITPALRLSTSTPETLKTAHPLPAATFSGRS